MNSAVAAFMSSMTVPAPSAKACTAPTTALASISGTTDFTPKTPGVKHTICNNATATCGKPGAGAP